MINLSEHRKEGWTRHILDHRGYVLLDLLVHAKLFVPERTMMATDGSSPGLGLGLGLGTVQFDLDLDREQKDLLHSIVSRKIYCTCA